jgi:hypothetical protein
MRRDLEGSDSEAIEILSRYSRGGSGENNEKSHSG